MTLAELAIGVSVTVTHVGGERAFRRRLMELGLLPGTRVEVVRVAPLGDPMELSVRGCQISIRREEAGSIEVTASPLGATEAASPSVDAARSVPAPP